ncbi:unnamed protein product, partial [Ectocarpus sp. 12 AP-2014]
FSQAGTRQVSLACVPLQMDEDYVPGCLLKGDKRDLHPYPSPLSSLQDRSPWLLLPLSTYAIGFMGTPSPPARPTLLLAHPSSSKCVSSWLCLSLLLSVSLTHTLSSRFISPLFALSRQPPSSPLLYRTAWHVPLFPNDLVLKICIHESDQTNVNTTLAALDSRGCYLLVVPATAGGGGRAKATANIGVIPSRVRGGFAPSCSSTRQIRTGGFGLPTPPSRTPKANNKRGSSFESPLPPAAATATAAAAARPHALSLATRSVSLSRLSTPSPAAARARAAAAAAVIANAKAV